MYKIDSSGNVTILIRATGAMTLMGVDYAANDVVAVFDNAYFSLGFSNQNKTVTKGPINILGFNTMAPENIEIESKSLTYSYFNFIAGKKSVDQSIYIPVKENMRTDSAGSVFLIRVPSNSKNIIIKNPEGEKATGYTVDYQTGQITDLSVNTNYTAYYYYQDVSLVGFNLKEVQTPYFKIEIVGENNINGVSRYMLLEIPRASIDITATLQFQNDVLTAPELRFKIIDGEASIIYY